ncbi:hypothetical protein [Herbiconiux liangxiaofengii]|uniref:hypothetical protein n=1 Tax=Herbiconiux liangxiaofengii TaxID=3342795 RepID=UPI0035BAF599
MTLPDDPDQTGIEFAGVPAEPDPDGAILDEPIPETSSEADDEGAVDEEYTGVDADDRSASQPNWKDFTSEVLEPDEGQPFGDKTPDDLRD